MVCLARFNSMTTEQQLELEEIRKLIRDRFDKQDEKINEIRIELAGIKIVPCNYTCVIDQDISRLAIMGITLP